MLSCEQGDKDFDEASLNTKELKFTTAHVSPENILDEEEETFDAGLIMRYGNRYFATVYVMIRLEDGAVYTGTRIG